MTFEYMTEKEIVNSYVRNGKTKAQIKRLAELNACTTTDIKRLLDKNGVLKYVDTNMPVPVPKIEDEKKEPIEYVVPMSVWVSLKEEQTRLHTKIELHKKELQKLQQALNENIEFLKMVESLMK